MRKTHEDTHYASATFRCLKKIYQVPGLYCTDLHGWHTQLQGLWARSSCCCSGQGEACGSRWGPSFCSLIMTSQNLALFQVCPYLLIYPWSFYRGRVYVGVKYLVLEPSSPLRHIAVLKQILLDEDLLSIPILCLFSDVGPYHRLTYLSVQLSLICLFFFSGDFDILIAARTPSNESWRNQPERIMSILNLALQAVGLMRS